MNPRDIQRLYQNNGFIVKENKKAEITYGDQEYQSQEMCYQHLKSFRHAIDIGARYGGWSRAMQIKFGKLTAFEPRARWRAVYPLNIVMDNVTLYPYGLGEQDETVMMQGNKITNSVLAKEEVTIKKLDDFDLTEVDFIKIDTDGYELNVLKGGTQTLLNNRPIVCMEVIPGELYHGELAEEYLLSLGYQEIDSCGQNKLFGYTN